jgi:RES domain-containing protein
VILWRIATETRTFAARDLTGAGAALNPGRWNEHGQAAVYTAPSVALAVLETAAHVDTGGLPLNRFLVQIRVPDDVWAARESLDVTRLPPEWASIPAGRASVATGSAWINSVRTLVLVVPSVIVPEESAAIINPAHHDARRLEARVSRAFEYDKLFRHGA